MLNRKKLSIDQNYPMRHFLFLLYVFFVLFLFACGKNSPSHTIEIGMVPIPAGQLELDAKNRISKKMDISAFQMDETEVTNAQFSQFVKETQYQTVAERKFTDKELIDIYGKDVDLSNDSLRMPGALVFKPTKGPVNLNEYLRWWEFKKGASWQHPHGPKSDIEDLMDHPVVQVSFLDAAAYCKWASKRLPTEWEWEWAAKGGKEKALYAWGNEDINTGKPRANFYQGMFPYINTKKDGYTDTAPVKSYAPNGYGLYDMSGNVWEWCSNWLHPNGANGERVIRGGSFLCTDEYCSGFRISNRMGSSPDTGLGHTGCRCVKDL